MNKPLSVDAAALNLMLSELRLPRIRSLWPRFTEQADHPGQLAAELSNRLLTGNEGWPAARLLAALTEHENGYRVLFTRTTDLTQRLQMARRVACPGVGDRQADKYHLLILDDFAYATKDQAETSCAVRAHQRPLRATLDARHRQWQPFGQWEAVHPATDPDAGLRSARCDLALESAIFEPDTYDLLILDDFAYAIEDRRDQCAGSSAPATSNAARHRQSAVRAVGGHLPRSLTLATQAIDSLAASLGHERHHLRARRQLPAPHYPGETSSIAARQRVFSTAVGVTDTPGIRSFRPICLIDRPGH